MVEPDHEALWSNLERLLARLVDAADRGTFLDDCLDLLVDLLEADRGLLVVFHEDGGTQIVNARGKGRALDAFEREEISRSVIDRVRRDGESRIFRPLDELGSTESMQALSISAAVAAPLLGAPWRGSAGVRAVVYLDVRDRRKHVGEAHRAFLDAAAKVMAAVLEPYERLRVAEEDLRALAAGRPDDGPSLDELLRFDSLHDLRREVASCLLGESSILILGESGTGKTQLARAIAGASGRRPIVRATLGSSDDLNTITSELFGHEKGSFSGALGKRTGLVELADGGTLIFDEILNLPPAAQQILLDFTQFGTYRPLGHHHAEPRRSRVRIIAATNGDLDEAMRGGRFRPDLYYRLATATVTIPPLRARRQDIPTLAEGILRRRGQAKRLGVGLRRLLMSPDLGWPGNVRQLEAVLARAVERAALADPGGDVITPTHVEPRDLGCVTLAVPPPAALRDPAAPLSAGFQIELEELGDSLARLTREREVLDGHERILIDAALRRHDGVAAHAARELGVPRTSLLSRMDTLGVARRARR